MSSVKDFVDSTIRDNKIVIFSKTYCPYCKASKAYFSDNYSSEPVHVVELDVRDDASTIQDYLLQVTGARSVPRIFINGHIVGGNDNLQKLPKDKVKDLIEGPRA